MVSLELTETATARRSRSKKNEAERRIIRIGEGQWRFSCRHAREDEETVKGWEVGRFGREGRSQATRTSNLGAREVDARDGGDRKRGCTEEIPSQRNTS
jgi:hypothetical protein